MPDQDCVELTAYWGSDDAESTIKISAQMWEEIKTGARFQTNSKSYYEGEVYEVTWSFFDTRVSIDGDDGMQCVVQLPVEDLSVCSSKTWRSK